MYVYDSGQPYLQLFCPNAGVSLCYLRSCRGEERLPVCVCPLNQCLPCIVIARGNGDGTFFPSPSAVSSKPPLHFSPLLLQSLKLSVAAGCLSNFHPCHSNHKICQLLLAASPFFTPATPTVKIVSCCWLPLHFSPLPLQLLKSSVAAGCLSILHPCHSNHKNRQLLLAASPFFTPAAPTISFVSCCWLPLHLSPLPLQPQILSVAAGCLSIFLPCYSN